MSNRLKVLAFLQQHRPAAFTGPQIAEHTDIPVSRVYTALSHLRLDDGWIDIAGTALSPTGKPIQTYVARKEPREQKPEPHAHLKGNRLLRLRAHVAGLKDELQKAEKTIRQRDAEIAHLRSKLLALGVDPDAEV